MLKQEEQEKFTQLQGRLGELEQLLASQEIISNKDEYSKYAKELSSIRDKVYLFRKYKKIAKDIEELNSVLKESHEEDFLELARKELEDLKNKLAQSEAALKQSLKEEDKYAGRAVIVEIRQGTGGDEAGLFAADLYRMYTKYAVKKNWVAEVMFSNSKEFGGFKEIIFSVKGRDAYKMLQFESGVHRVQRVPATEAQGRIHTSTATVAVLPEAEEVDFFIEPKDLRIDTYRSSGPGGQHMQKTDSAVRITHLPTGMLAVCQDERSQLKNKTKALRILRARLLDFKREEESKKISIERKSQIGTGDRSEKIRTYNFPDRRVTDHRINFTSHNLEGILEGNLDELSEALLSAASGESDESR